jgi:hypothetical protein
MSTSSLKGLCISNALVNRTRRPRYFRLSRTTRLLAERLLPNYPESGEYPGWRGSSSLLAYIVAIVLRHVGFQEPDAECQRQDVLLQDSMRLGHSNPNALSNAGRTATPTAVHTTPPHSQNYVSKIY